MECAFMGGNRRFENENFLFVFLVGLIADQGDWADLGFGGFCRDLADFSADCCRFAEIWVGRVRTKISDSPKGGPGIWTLFVFVLYPLPYGRGSLVFWAVR